MREIIFEFITIGKQTKIIAIDVETGIEACVITPLSASRNYQIELARKKLQYILNKS